MPQSSSNDPVLQLIRLLQLVSPAMGIDHDIQGCCLDAKEPQVDIYFSTADIKTK